MAELVRGIEEEDRQLREASSSRPVDINTGGGGHRACARPRATRAAPLPHPDDIVLDFQRAEVRYEGPLDEREKASHDELADRRAQRRRP